MKFLLLLLSLNVFADVKISNLPLGSPGATATNDSFPYVDSTAAVTRRLKISDLPNTPFFVSYSKSSIAYTSTVATISSLSKDYYLVVNTYATSLYVILPDAQANVGYCVSVKNAGTTGNLLNVFPPIGQTIDGASVKQLTSVYEAVRTCPVEGHWFIF